jgi:parvulin-like peptidyl-prolyl isomerase
MWLPVAVAFGAFLLYVKGKKDAEVSFKTSRLKQELKERRVIDETVVNTDRDAAIKRLQSNGGLRD